MATQQHHEPMGVSVTEMAGHFYLRVHMRDAHLEPFKGDRFMIRGKPAEGFILAPDTKNGLKASRTGNNLLYILTSVNNIDLSKRKRRTVWLNPELDGGRWRVPPLPPAWIDVEPEFDPEVARVVESGPRTVALPKNARDDGVPLPPVNGHNVVPAPMPEVPGYTVPSSLYDMQCQLAGVLNDARGILRAMEDKCGLKFTLDRNLRVVVVLPDGK